MKSTGLAFVLWCLGLLGFCGLHRFYTGRYATGIIWLFTLGLLGVGQLIDLFLLSGMVRMSNLEAMVHKAAAGPTVSVINHVHSISPPPLPKAPMLPPPLPSRDLGR